MLILRGAIISVMFASPIWAEDTAPVVGAKRVPHHAAPQPVDGEGDYGFAGVSPEPTEQPTTPVTLISPDDDLLAYDQEEALIEAEAALAADESAEASVVID